MNAIKDALKSSALVWLFTTIGLWIPGLLGWVNEVSSWAAQKGAPPFPDPSNLAFLFVAALTAAFPAAVAGLVRLVENLSGQTLLPRTSSTPVHDPSPGERGATTVWTASGTLILLTAIAMIVIFLPGAPPTP